MRNYRQSDNARRHDKHEPDHKPVVRYFHPFSPAVWLITEMNPKDEIMFGLCDMGVGFPELGYVALEELERLKFMGLGVERDKHWTAKGTLRQYTEAADMSGRIVDIRMMGASDKS